MITATATNETSMKIGNRYFVDIEVPLSNQ